jgi:SHS2 domain-containing protein
MIRMLEHTADVGFEIGAPTLEALFDEARRALLMTMFERPPERSEEESPVWLSAADLEILLVRWVNELVYLIQSAGVVPVRAEIRIRQTDMGGFFLEGLLAGAAMDFERYGWQGEIKSATFHGLAVVPKGEGWQARVILDV